MEAPDNDAVSDQDSDEDDEIAEGNVNHLDGRILKSSASALLVTSDGIEEIGNIDDRMCHSKTADDSTTKPKKRKVVKYLPEWHKGDCPVVIVGKNNIPVFNKDEYSGMSPAELFELFYNEEKYAIIKGERRKDMLTNLMTHFLMCLYQN